MDGLIALAAVWGGVSLIAGAPGFRFPAEWLATAGLHNWVLPGIELIVLIGGVMAWASVAGWRNTPHAPTVSLLAAIVLFVWLLVQVTVIGPRTPIHVLTAAADLAVILLACQAAARRKSW